MLWKYGVEIDWLRQRLSSQGNSLKTFIPSLAQLRSMLPQIPQDCPDNTPRSFMRIRAATGKVWIALEKKVVLHLRSILT